MFICEVAAQGLRARHNLGTPGLVIIARSDVYKTAFDIAQINGSAFAGNSRSCAFAPRHEPLRVSSHYSTPRPSGTNTVDGEEKQSKTRVRIFIRKMTMPRRVDNLC
jgi:hypothetical protein